MQDRLTLGQIDVLRGLRNGKMQLAHDPTRYELVKLGLVEMKLGGWGLTQKGRQRSLFR